MKKIIIVILMVLSGFNLVLSQSKKITYVSDQNSSGYYQVFVMNEDGSDQKQITDMSTDCYFPKWSPDGTKIVFYTEDGRIFFIDKVDTDKPDDPFFVFGGEHPSFGTDGETIIFNSDFEGILTIYAMMYNESEPIIVSNIGYSNQQVLSRDGSKIVFSSFYEKGKDVMLIDLDDTTENNFYKISNNDNANLLPDISSDNLMIVWASFNNNLQGSIHLYKDGKESAIYKTSESANRPRFSPDDSKIAFVTIGETKIGFSIMNNDGSGRKSYDLKGGNVANFIWIDTGRILYDAEDGKNYNIGILDVSTGKSTLLTGQGSSMHPDILN
jgi:Tol biopolymer transport system component